MPKAGQSAAIKKTAIGLIAFTIRFDACTRQESASDSANLMRFIDLPISHT
jgi:hypothetical protein